MNANKRSIYLRMAGMFLADMVFVILADLISIRIRFESGMQPWQEAALRRGLPPLLIVWAACFIIGGMYRQLWQYAGAREVARITVVCAAGGLISVMLNSFLDMSISRLYLVLHAILVLVLTGGFRFLWYVLFSRRSSFARGAGHRRVLIMGAGTAGAFAANICRTQPERFGMPVGFLDDDPGKYHMRASGVTVLGRLDEAGRIAEEKKADAIIIAIPSLKGDAMRRVVEMATATKKQIYIFSSPEAITGKRPSGTIRELDVSDFLSRDEVRLDTDLISGYIAGKTVLVTGGGGSIGSEICRQLLRFDPERLVIFDIYENTAYELLYDLRLLYPETKAKIEILIGSIRDRKRLDEVFDQVRPQVVFHAAAHKHVPLMEVSPAEAVKNNVFGTWNLLSSAAEHGVERLVQLSTDKAVNPTNVMGATKRVTEMMIQYFARSTQMKCMAVRFGNVLGSHGSVIPLFEQQIRRGGPVTVMDSEIERFFMTIPEAAQLVLQAGALAKTGSIYVLDMGTPVKIIDLAYKLIRFYGYEPNVDMPVKITGLRPGEKMYEELMMDDERKAMTCTAHDLIFVAPPIPMEDSAFRAALETLRAAAEHNDASVVKALESVVPTYRPNRKEQAV